MDDEFALCWNNFQDNIAVGFQNLYDRGDLVDVTLACDGKLLQAHKIVLAICSPYFQEMFISNPCKHPIIVLKDVGYSVMIELLQFMYQGVVNVKHTELSSFMKIAQTLQIKGLTTSSTQKSPSQNQNTSSNNSKGSSNNSNINENQTSGNVIETKINSSSFLNNKTSDNATSSSSSGGIKRTTNEFQNSDPLSIYPKRLHKQRNSDPDDHHHDINNDSMDHMSSDDVFLPPIPQISMTEPKFDLNRIKCEFNDPPTSPGGVRNSIPPSFNFDYNMYPNKPIEYPNELHMSNDYPKGAGNHMDIPPGSSITMLSSTSLLHGNCIFNRNNTVATQQGMKTYWLCKSYRITMCRARCITHQGRVISATGVHNHQPHMKPPSSNDYLGSLVNTSSASGMNGANIMPNNSGNCLSVSSSIRMAQNSHHQQQHQQHISPHHHTSQQIQSAHQLHHTNNIQGHQHSANNAAVIQNMMQNVLSQNNLMHLTNMAPMLNSVPQHSVQLNNIHAPSSLEITPILNTSSTVNRGRNHQMDSPGIHSSSPQSNNGNNSNVPVVSSSSVITVSATSPADENCNSVSQDSSNSSSHSNIIPSITISPTQPSFKMEHI